MLNLFRYKKVHQKVRKKRNLNDNLYEIYSHTLREKINILFCLFQYLLEPLMNFFYLNRLKASLRFKFIQ